ncbi:hypothetical protein BXT84_00910 [Sulfobacillus thermotolerans]|uniref:HTH cro/C1-type domain-containing protein n=1 Tax=Sulfobacillus thermotolerans TaxID=338644 RepID=A0ABM6RMX9_9FIRM|nr:hypothetical protein BXT84_00910 [Sulfobacillus thermotolerans]
MDRKTVLGQRLTSARLTKQWTKQALANQIGVSDVLIGYFERGRRWPSVPTLIALAEVLEVSTDYLLGLTSEPPSKGPPTTG